MLELQGRGGGGRARLEISTGSKWKLILLFVVVFWLGEG